jgi:transposase
MLQLTAKHKVFIAINAIDFRKGMDGIAGYCKSVLELDPFSGHIFVFRNSKFKGIKILVYDSQGFCLYHKRLSQGKFRWWPKNQEQVAQLSISQLNNLLWNDVPANTIGKSWRSP